MAYGARILNGPRLPAARGAATHLVVLCHGYGADGNDLIGLAPHWQRLMPTISFVAPNAPEPCQGGPGFQWFPISRLEPDAMRRGVEGAASTLNAFLDAELTRANLPEERLALVGFSQGTMMALHVGLKRKPLAIMGYSGLLADRLTEMLQNPPPVLLVHGDADPMIPADYLFVSAGVLGRAGVPVQWHLSPRTPHAIDETGLAAGAAFLSLAFRGQLRPKLAEIACPIG